MELIITEKPGVARAIAAVLGAAEHRDGYLQGKGFWVSWCVGHLVELALPEAYDARYARWRYKDLPILPETWQYTVSAGTQKQFAVLASLMNDEHVTGIICATDAGREGELIFRLVYQCAKCRKPVRRLWISSMEESAIREGFRNLKPMAAYDNLYQAALCRAQADWLIGMNATRLYSLLYGPTLHVGRVMSPTLSMLAQREEAFRLRVAEAEIVPELPAFGVGHVEDLLHRASFARSLAQHVLGLGLVERELSFEFERLYSHRNSPFMVFRSTSLRRNGIFPDL